MLKEGRDETLGHRPTSKILSFCRAQMVVKCTSAGQLTGQRTVDKLLLLKKQKEITDKSLAEQPVTLPPKFSEVTSLKEGKSKYSLGPGMPERK